MIAFKHPVERLKYRHLELWGGWYKATVQGRTLDPDEIGDWLVELIAEDITPHYAERMLSFRDILTRATRKRSCSRSGVRSPISGRGSTRCGSAVPVRGHQQPCR